MVHAREDYNRFQEPKELIDTIRFLISTIKCKEPISDEKLDSILGGISRRYDYAAEGGTPIKEDEPVLLLRAKDKHFVSMIRAYLALVARDMQMTSESFESMARSLSDLTSWALEWQKSNPDIVKSPDL